MRSRRWIGLGLAVAVGVGVSAPALAQQPDPALIEQLRASAEGSVEVTTNESTGRAAFIEAADLLPASREATPVARADRFLSEYAPLLGADGASTLKQTASTTDADGATHVTYAQTYKGLPVFGAQVKAHIDADGELTTVNGLAVPGIDLSVAPRLSTADAAARAVAAITSEPLDGTHPGALRALATELMVYRTGLIRGLEGTNELAYRVPVSDGVGVGEQVFIHADSGKTLNRYPDRELYAPGAAAPIWQEGDPFPGTLTPDQQNVVIGSGETYRFFLNSFGRDSYDGNGAPMRATMLGEFCPTVGWNGALAQFCNGVTSDDFVGHGWGYAYTDHTKGVIYQWQPGALTESYSDIWGEVIDQLNGRGIDTPNTRRSDGACSSNTYPQVTLRINAPAQIASECDAGSAFFGRQLDATGVSGEVVLAQDGVGGTDTSTTNGCTPPFTNNLAGKIALIDRGVCLLPTKIANAQAAGAIAVVIGNTQEGVAPIAGSFPQVTIPSVVIALTHRNLIVDQLTAGQTVNVTLRAKINPENSFRWLVGEEADAYRGPVPPGHHALRDMWDPKCIYHPGKVSDAQYACDFFSITFNSGVPNHGFALLVDGGTYNGRTVRSIGLTKAAHLYWRAQSVYLTPSSGFPEHADALEASCRDLVGRPLRALSTGAPAGWSGQSITRADCAAVDEMVAATELRTSPATQCAYTPLLEPGSPDVCPGQKTSTVYSTDFKHGLDGWKATNEGRQAAWPRANWRTTDSLPGRHRGSAAYAPDLGRGSCDGSPGDIAGVMRMTSPAIRLPTSRVTGLRLTFEHYVAIERLYDGGNLKISVNGGEYALVPGSAFRFNAYNEQLLDPSLSSNPLAGQEAFTDTNPDGLGGSWGESQVDLTDLGVAPGDTIRVRFELGIDGCTGADGWYVSDVAVKACTTKKGRQEDVQ